MESDLEERKEHPVNERERLQSRPKRKGVLLPRRLDIIYESFKASCESNGSVQKMAHKEVVKELSLDRIQAENQCDFEIEEVDELLGVTSNQQMLFKAHANNLAII